MNRVNNVIREIENDNSVAPVASTYQHKPRPQIIAAALLRARARKYPSTFGERNARHTPQTQNTHFRSAPPPDEPPPVKAAVGEEDRFANFCMLLGVNESALRMMLDKPSKSFVPPWEKPLLTLDEAAAYFGIGVNHLREMTNNENCTFVLFNHSKRMIKRERLEEYLSKAYSI